VDVKKEAGIEDSLIRISIGIEDSDDLFNDLKYAIKQSVNQTAFV